MAILNTIIFCENNHFCEYNHFSKYDDAVTKLEAATITSSRVRITKDDCGAHNVLCTLFLSDPGIPGVRSMGPSLS